MELAVCNSAAALEEFTKLTDAAAVLISEDGPLNLVGKTLDISEGDGSGTPTPTSVTFTGTNPLSAASIVSQINTAAGYTLAAVDGTRVKITSTVLGIESVIILGTGDANPILGWLDGFTQYGAGEIDQSLVVEVVDRAHEWYLFYYRW